jgi:beta-glucosidase
MKIIKNFHIIMAMSCFVSCHNQPDYKNSSLSIDKRVDDLLSRMTLEEKAAQLDMLSGNDILVDYKTLNDSKAYFYIDSMGIGAIHDLYPRSAELSNAIQKHAVEKSRLGIPLLFVEEALHGYQGTGATTFPIPLGLSSSWDTTLINQIGSAIGEETRAHGIHYILGPNLDLARDIRWGRVEETYGEDVYLTSRMGVNLIKGLQGKNLADDNAVIAEPKHFAMHGSPENGSNEGPVSIGERDARSTGLYVFEKAVKEAHAKGIMAAYHEIDGIPCIANKWLLTDVLRNEWKFDGFVLSDLGAIKKQVTLHKTATDDEEAIIKSISAGLDMQFYDFPHSVFQHIIVESVKKGKLSEDYLNRAVKGIVSDKFRLGLFDHPYIDVNLINKVFHSKDHQNLALDAAHQSIVLLKNDKGILPLKSFKSITLTGNLANATYTGGYSPAESKAISVYDALKKSLGNIVKINYVNTEVSDRFTNIQTTFLSQDKKGEVKGLKLDFFNNDQLQGSSAYSATEDNLNPYWHNLSPAPGINPQDFSAIWSGFLSVPVTGNYEFDFRAEGYGKLIINNKILIDNWNEEWKNRGRRATIRLKAGEKIPFCMEFAKKVENAGIWLKWRMVETDDLNLYHEIATSASKSDVVIVVMGEGQDEVGESRDKYDLNPNNMDMKILHAATQSGKPVVTIMITGRPLILTNVYSYSDALLQAWFGGEAAGTAIVDVLNGDYNPSGHLTVSFPEKQGQEPMYYSKNPSSHRHYFDGDTKPLFAFGYGLSYSSFNYTNLKIEPEHPTVTDDIMVTVDVSNTSTIDGADVVQLYLVDKVSSVEIPEKQLKAFSKVFIKAGETRKVSMLLKNEQLSLINDQMKRVVEPGEFEILIGSSSDQIKLNKDFIVK